MKQHLEENCLGCEEQQEHQETWASVLKFTHSDLLVEPSLQSVLDAKHLFSILKNNGCGDTNLLVAQLEFDSYTQVATGVRGGCSVPRQLLYKCGHVCIDMQLEPNLCSRRVELVGQIFIENSPTQKMPDLPVSLLSDGDPVYKTNTNQFGEFYFGFNPLRHPQLLLSLDKDKMIVPIPETGLESN